MSVGTPEKTGTSEMKGDEDVKWMILVGVLYLTNACTFGPEPIEANMETVGSGATFLVAVVIAVGTPHVISVIRRPKRR